MGVPRQVRWSRYVRRGIAATMAVMFPFAMMNVGAMAVVDAAAAPSIQASGARPTHLGGLYSLSMTTGAVTPQVGLTLSPGTTNTGALPVTVTAAVYQNTTMVAQSAKTISVLPGSPESVTESMGTVSATGNYTGEVTVTGPETSTYSRSFPLDIIGEASPGLSPSAWFAGGDPIASLATSTGVSNNPTELTAGGTAEILGQYGTASAPAFAGYTVTLHKGLSQPMLYLRYSSGTSNVGSVVLRSSAATTPFGSVTGAVYQTAAWNQPTGMAWFSSWKYLKISLPHAVPAGTYHLFVVDNPKAPNGDTGNFIVNYGVLTNLQLQGGGLWSPPPIRNGQFTGLARTSPLLTVHSANWSSPTGMYEWSGSPVTPTIDLVLHNHSQTAITPTVSVTLTSGAHGSTSVWSDAQDPVTASLAPGAVTNVSIPTTALDQVNYYGAKVQIALNGQVIQTENMGTGLIYPPNTSLQPNSPFGINARGIQIGGNPTLLHELVQQIGAKWVRNGFADNMNVVNPGPGQYWTTAEINVAKVQIEAWNQSGIEVSGMVSYAPSWNTQDYPTYSMNRPENMEDQAEAVFHLIQPLSGLVKDWEIWNEPWSHGYTWETGTGADYREMAKLIYQTVKPVLPNVMLIGGGSLAYQRDLLYGGKSHIGYIDGSVDHDYSTPTRQFVGWSETQRAMDRKDSVSHGVAGIWNTEFGTYPGFYPTLSPTEQQVRIAQSVAPEFVLQILGAGKTPVHLDWFSIGDIGYAGDTFNIWNTATGSPNPSMVAYAAMTHFLDTASLVGDAAPHARSVWPIVYQRSNGHALGVLFADNRSGAVTIPDSPNLRVYNYLGAPVTGTVSDGTVTLSLKSWQADYIESTEAPAAMTAQLDAAQWDVQRGVLVEPLPLTQIPGSHPITVGVQVENTLTRPITGKLTLTVPTGWTLAPARQAVPVLAPGQKRTIVFTVPTSVASVVNRYPLQWTLQYQEQPALGSPPTPGGLPSLVSPPLIGLPIPLLPNPSSFKIPGQMQLTETGNQTVQVAVAPYATINVNGPVSQWSTIPMITMVNPSSTDYATLESSPAAVATALANPSPTMAVDSLKMAWNHQDLFLEAQVPTTEAAPSATASFTPGAVPATTALVFGFRNLAHNPSDLVPEFPGYNKAGLHGSVDYEFAAYLNEANDPVLYRVAAPGTNLQDYYPSSAPTDPALGVMPTNSGNHSQAAISYDAADGMETFQIALPWREISTLGASLNSRLLSPGSLMTHFAWMVSLNGNDTLWTTEAGMFRAGTYGFPPFWDSSNGAITTPWTFDGASMSPPTAPSLPNPPVATSGSF